jgi:hypothetical protein
MIFRNDDVCASTNYASLSMLYDVIRRNYPNAKIWSCISMFSKNNFQGSVYPDLPLKDRSRGYFMQCDEYFKEPAIDLGVKASHGLIHLPHDEMNYQEQEISILTTCNILKTKLFVPPFNRFNGNTVDICQKHSIRLVRPDDGWRSLEFEPFNPDHDLWYFHSWRFTPQEFKEKITNELASKSYR